MSTPGTDGNMAANGSGAGGSGDPSLSAGEGSSEIEVVPGDEASPLPVASRVARRRRVQRPVPGRTTAVVAAVVVLVGVGLVSLAEPAPAPAPAAPPRDGVAIAPTTALTSSFFCATGAGLDAGAGATGTVVLTNTSRATARGVMTAVESSGSASVRRDVSVPPLGASDVVPAQGLAAGVTASTFTFAGGGVTGTMVVGNPSGWSTAPCPSTVASEWDFVGGSTATGLLDLSLYNPTATQTMVDVSFLTPSGDVLFPQAYQGLTLPPGQVLVEGLGAYVQNQTVVATVVQSTSGSLVATELDQLVVKSGSGLALVSGSPGPATTWRFAQTTAVQGGSVDFSVANPGQSTVTAQVSVGLSSASVTPKQLTVPGHTVVSLVASAVPGWPLGSPYSVTVAASSPVVVGRSVVAPPSAISPQGGLIGGTTATATSWLVVGPGSAGNPLVAGGAIRSLAIADPGSSPVEVTVTPLAGGRPVARVMASPSGLVVLGASVVGGLRPLVVTASGPVDVEVDEGPSGAPGVVSASGFPFGG